MTAPTQGRRGNRPRHDYALPRNAPAYQQARKIGFFDEERDVLTRLAGSEDADVKAMATQALAGDINALIMLLDAMADAGASPEDLEEVARAASYQTYTAGGPATAAVHGPRTFAQLRAAGQHQEEAEAAQNWTGEATPENPHPGQPAYASAALAQRMAGVQHYIASPKAGVEPAYDEQGNRRFNKRPRHVARYARPDYPTKSAPRFVPAEGLHLGGDFYQGGEAITEDILSGLVGDVLTPEEAAEVYGVLHSDRGLAEEDYLRRPTPGKEGTAPSFGRPKRLPYDEPPLDPKVALLPIDKGQPHADRLPEDIRRHMTEEEHGEVRSAQGAATLVSLLDQLPSRAEVAIGAELGQAKRGWYQDAAHAIVHVFGAQAPRFAALLGATSPNKGVRANIQNSAAIWAAFQDWQVKRVKQGQGPPTAVEVKSWLKDKNTYAAVRALGGYYGIGDDEKSGETSNIARALGIDTDPTQRNTLSGPKIDSFASNLQATNAQIQRLMEVTNDTWQAYGFGLDQNVFGGSSAGRDELGGKGSRDPRYIAASVRIRQAAEWLNQHTAPERPWWPAEVQETYWSAIRGLAALGGLPRRGKGRQIGPDPVEAMDMMTHEWVRANADLATALLNDKVVYDALSRDPRLKKALGNLPEALARVRATDDSLTGGTTGGHSGGDTILRRPLQESLARKAGRAIGSFAHATGEYADRRFDVEQYPSEALAALPRRPRRNSKKRPRHDYMARPRQFPPHIAQGAIWHSVLQSYPEITDDIAQLGDPEAAALYQHVLQYPMADPAASGDTDAWLDLVDHLDALDQGGNFFAGDLSAQIKAVLGNDLVFRTPQHLNGDYGFAARHATQDGPIAEEWHRPRHGYLRQLRTQRLASQYDEDDDPEVRAIAQEAFRDYAEPPEAFDALADKHLERGEEGRANLVRSLRPTLPQTKKAGKRGPRHDYALPRTAPAYRPAANRPISDGFQAHRMITDILETPGDDDISRLAEPALEGDFEAMVMLYDALLDAGRDTDAEKLLAILGTRAYSAALNSQDGHTWPQQALARGRATEQYMGEMNAWMRHRRDPENAPSPGFPRHMGTMLATDMASLEHYLASPKEGRQAAYDEQGNRRYSKRPHKGGPRHDYALPRSAPRYVERVTFTPDAPFSIQSDLFSQLSTPGYPEDVRNLAEQAGEGDFDALVLLHDAMLDAGIPSDHPHMAWMAFWINNYARSHTPVSAQAMKDGTKASERGRATYRDDIWNAVEFGMQPEPSSPENPHPDRTPFEGENHAGNFASLTHYLGSPKYGQDYAYDEHGSRRYRKRRYAAQNQPQSALVASSSNTEQDMSFDEAFKRSQSDESVSFRKIADGFMAQLGLEGKNDTAVGDWEDGAEHSLLTSLPPDVDIETLKYLGAWYGLTGNQRAVLVFRPEQRGLDSVYEVETPETDVQKVRQALSAAGVPYRTIVPSKKGTRVVVYDEKRKLRDNVAHFAGLYNAPVRESIGSGAYVGADSRAAARKAFRDTIAEYESRSGRSLRQG
jgi:hypothetical protein